MGTGKRGPWVTGPWPPGAFVWPCLSSSPLLSYVSSGSGLLSLVPPPRHLHLLRRPPLPLSLHRLLHRLRPIPALCPLSGPGCRCCCFLLSRIPAVYHRCGLDVGPLCVHGDFQLRSHCARLAEGAGDLRGLYHLRPPWQHLPVPAPTSPEVAVTPSASSQQLWPGC